MSLSPATDVLVVLRTGSRERDRDLDPDLDFKFDVGDTVNVLTELAVKVSSESVSRFKLVRRRLKSIFS